jgi:hypothetical protein
MKISTTKISTKVTHLLGGLVDALRDSQGLLLLL